MIETEKIEEMENPSRFLPPKLQTVANAVRKNMETLEKGGRRGDFWSGSFLEWLRLGEQCCYSGE